MFDHLFSESGLSLDRLRSFLAIAEARGIMAAAKGDANRQSQLSRQLAELETFFGAPLVLRGKQVSFALTPTGETLKGSLIQAFRSLDSIKGQQADGIVPLRVGAGESVLAWLVLPRLPVMSKSHPKARMVCLNLRSADIMKQLAEGSLDLGIVRKPVSAKMLKCVNLGSSRFLLAVPKGMSKSTDAAKLLTTLPLAVLDDSSSHEEMLAAYPGDAPQIGCLCTSYAQVRSAVLSGACAAIIPEFMAHDLETKCRLLKLPNAKPIMSLSVVWNPTSLHSRPSTEVLVEWAVKKWLKLTA
jgi:DNA-binding transcriptional LysR family regulator